RERRARELAHAEMIMLMGVCVERGFEAAQAIDPAQLGEDQRHQMIPAVERFVVGIAIETFHNRAELPPIDRFEEARKDAIAVSHPRSLSGWGQPESTRFTPVGSGMPRYIVNHS